jgi:ubiquinone/menaquinone biosynthesis C-methylase UbiE
MDTPANAEFIQVWNEVLVPKFTRFRHILVGGLSEHSRDALPRVGRPGERVLDVGCGFGETSIEIARRVRPDGDVVGLDCCGPFLETARADAERQGVTNVGFVEGDAQTFSTKVPFDACFSRFGTMFFMSPVAAMRNVRHALRPGGRLTMIVWRALDDNVWARLPKQIALQHLPPPPDNVKTCGPGPFSMADRETVREILGLAGFARVEFERVDAPIMAGKTIDEAIEFALMIGPAGEIMREAGPLGDEKKPALIDDLRRAFEAYRSDGGIVMPSGSWTVTAVSA